MKPTRPRPTTALALGFALLVGCGDGESRMSRRTVEIAKVPAPLLQAARKQIPGVEFTEAWSNHVKGREAIHSYEIRGKNTATGKTREVRIAPDGTILEEE